VGPPESKGTVLEGEELGECLEPFVFGLHFSTASTEALQGCTCNGYENMTRMTIAAFAMVDATEGTSIALLITDKGLDLEPSTYTSQRCSPKRCHRMTSTL
jgi:hypothetical protein